MSRTPESHPDKKLHDRKSFVLLSIYINNPSSFTWEIGVSKPEVGTNPSLNRGSAEGLDTASPS